MILTDEQQSAVHQGLQPLRIVAGAGTGKTTVMAERIAFAISSGAARPDEVLGLTFTNKAAAELKQRVYETVGGDDDITVLTYHSFGATLVAEHALELDLHPRTRLLNRAEAWQLLFSVFDEFRFQKRRLLRPSLVVSDALVLAARCADHLVEISAVEADCAEIIEHARWSQTREAALGRRELCQVVSAYDRRKRERHLIDHDDQIRLAVRLLLDRPGLAAALAAQHPIVLLDEYQDTNYAQRVLLQLIYGPGSAITAVGDDMQSIYAFRGAYLGNLIDFGLHFPPASEATLTENRRSGPTIVALANRIQSQIPAALPKNLAAEPGAPADRIECFLAADDDEEAGTIAADIVAAEQGTAFAEQAVLCRKRRLIDAIVGALEARRVPVEVVGTSGLLDRPEIVDLVAWLEVLADPSATVALIRIWRGPRYRLGWRDLAVLARHIRALRQDRSDHEAAPFSLFDALTNLDDLAELSGAGRSRLALFRREHAVLARAARRLPVVDLAETIAAKTGLWGVGGERTRDNLLRFLELAEDFTPVEGRPGLAGFVEYLHLLGESEEELAEAHLGDRDAVAVMTIHQAKGLEWDCVWVPGLAGSGSSRIFPDGRTGENPLTQQTAVPWWLHHEDRGFGDWRTSSKEGVDDAVRRRAREEEWRLLYVACTRARRQLVCSAAQWYPGPAAPQGPSEFYRFISGQTDLVTERFRHEPADIDPQVAAMERRRAAADRVGHQTLATRVDQGTLFDPAAATGAGAGGAASEAAAAPTALSVTGLVSYRRCPRQYYWMAVRPLPRRASESARIGTEVHRWIEQRSGGQLGLLEPEPGADPIDPGDPTDSIDPAHRLERPSATVLAGLRAAFLATPYADLNPARVEAPFVLAVCGRAVRGRIDAVYRRDDRFELVDFKTGSPPEDGDKAATAQLDLYAVAANDLWGEDPSVLRTTYCYLHRDGTYQLVETDWDSERLAKARADLAASLAGVAAGEYDAAPGRWCARCEWQAVCRPGRTFLASIAEAGPGGPC